MQFVPSKRGKPHLCFEGYQYRHNRDLKNGTSSWRCVRDGCSVIGHLVKEEEEQDFILKTEHDHLPSPSKIEAKKFQAEV